jgi:hypothetical protein
MFKQLLFDFVLRIGCQESTFTKKYKEDSNRLEHKSFRSIPTTKKSKGGHKNSKNLVEADFLFGYQKEEEDCDMP